MKRLIVSALLLTVSLKMEPSGRADTGDQIDPACSAPNRRSVVWMARAEAAKKISPRQRLKVANQTGASAQIGLKWDGSLALPHVLLRGPADQSVQVDWATSLSSAAWDSLLAMHLTGGETDWLDAEAQADAGRFYRLTLPEADPAQEPADDFLLLDQDGKTRELFYPNNLKAVVVVAAGDQESALDSVLTALKPFVVQTDPTAAQFWLLLNDPAATRTNAAARVQASGVDVRVLLDPDGLGNLALGFTHVGEVAVVQPPTFVLAYRGQLKFGSAAVTEQPYLAAALTNLVKDAPLTFLRTPVTGTRLLSADAAVPDYARDVAPIFHDHCAICHRPKDVAPFAMTEYSVITNWAPVIKHELLSKDMPPWHADPAYGHWTNSVELPMSNRMTLLRWINAGAPRGHGPDPLAELPLPPSYRVWPAELGPPDALITPGMQSVKLLGVEAYRYLFVQAPNPSNVWLRAAIILPSSPAIVHHYLVWTGQVGNKSPVANVSTYNDALAGYVPGEAPYIYPADSGYQLGTSNWLTFNLHYTPNGQDTNDLPTLALWYHKTPPAKTFHSVGPLNPFFEIPPGNPEYPIRTPDWVVNHPIRLHRFNPHMHLRGKRVSYTAFYPDGTQEVLLSVPDYNFRWQSGYQLAEPKMLPAGTKIVVQGAFDNSPMNLANPDPTATVLWGDQTANEMFVGFFDYVD